LAKYSSWAPEARIAVARAAMEAREFKRARRALEPLIADRPTMRVCLLMADLEQAEHGSAAASANGSPRHPRPARSGLDRRTGSPPRSGRPCRRSPAASTPSCGRRLRTCSSPRTRGGRRGSGRPRREERVLAVAPPLPGASEPPAPAPAAPAAPPPSPPRRPRPRRLVRPSPPLRCPRRLPLPLCSDARVRRCAGRAFARLDPRAGSDCRGRRRRRRAAPDGAPERGCGQAGHGRVPRSITRPTIRARRSLKNRPSAAASSADRPSPCQAGPIPLRTRRSETTRPPQ
jgi:HemY protein